MQQILAMSPAPGTGAIPALPTLALPLQSEDQIRLLHSSGVPRSHRQREALAITVRNWSK